MSVKSYIKRAVRYILKGIPEQKVYPQVSILAPNEYLKGRSALITGGTSGIGFEIAKAFINAGAEVVITGRNIDRVKKACLQINEQVVNKNSVYGIEMDNTDVSLFSSKIQEAINIIPSKKIDVLVNNAGVLGAHISNATEMAYDSVLDTNLKGPFFLSQHIGHYFKENSIHGNILNIASSSSLRPAASAYTLSKWGIRGLTIGLAKVLTPYGIVVNGLAPGQTATPMLRSRDSDGNFVSHNVPIGRFILPEEIANMAVILVSNMGRSIMGDIVYMTGGAGVFSNEDMDYSFK